MPPPQTTETAADRCRRYRRRILDISQSGVPLHIAPAFSCLELVDAVYHDLMRRSGDGGSPDTFVLSKGHGCLAQYVVLEDLGVLTSEQLDSCGRPGSILGSHPDYGVPGIEASTGSLGHGLGIAAGMALADKVRGDDRRVFVVLSDGELQEGSVWEAMMVAPSLGLSNLVALVDLNDFQSLGRTSETLPNFYPIVDKVASFGWDCRDVNGHDNGAIVEAVRGRTGTAPTMVLGRTVKGKGVSYMENVPIWHYRSPSAEEYQQALRELEAAAEAEAARA
ncbi:MAG: transketolase [Acidimicrobiia bacterium]|nr:transketolase [Acidimicrobiia bacterium]